MFENKSNISIKSGSERNFGIVFAIFFTIIALYPLLYAEPVRYWALIIAFIFLFLAIAIPKLLTFLNILWFKLGLLLGKIISPIVMALIFIFVVTPTAVIIRLFGKDLLSQKINRSAKSYWIQRKEPIGKMKNQF